MQRLTLFLPVLLLSIACGPPDFDIVIDLDPPELEAEEEGVEKPLCDESAVYVGDVRASAVPEGLLQGMCAIQGTVTIDADVEATGTSLNDIKEVRGDVVVERAQSGGVMRALERITGKLLIRGFTSRVNSPSTGTMAALKEVGALRMEGTSGDGARGLSGLRRVRGNVELMALNPTTSLYGLSALQVIDGDLVIDNARTFPGAQGLKNLSSIGGALRLTRVRNLKNLDDLESLRTLGSLHIGGALALETIRLPHITALGSLYVDDNTALKTVALPALVSLSQASTVKRNPALVGLSLPKLTSMPAGLAHCYNNSALQADLDALGARVGKDKLSVCP